MNSSITQMAETSLNSQSRGIKRKVTEESTEVAEKKPRIVGEDSGSFFSFVRNLFPFVSSMFKRNEKKNTVIDPSYTTEDSDTCSEAEEEIYYNCTDYDTATEYDIEYYDASYYDNNNNTPYYNTSDYDTSYLDTLGYKASECESLPSLECDFSDDSFTDYDITDFYDNPMIFLDKRTAIYNSDIYCLEEGIFLSNNTVDFFLSVLRDSKNQNQTYVFDSMFFAKLRYMQDPKNYYKKTSHRFKGHVLLNKKIWVIPVCENYHWYVITVINPETAIPQVPVMDSWRKKSYKSVKIVKELLRQKFHAEQEGNIEEIYVKIVDIPQQTNSYDCGLHAIRSAELFMTELALSYITLISDQENKMTSTHEIYEKVELLTRSQIVRYFIGILREED